MPSPDNERVSVNGGYRGLTLAAAVTKTAARRLAIVKGGHALRFAVPLKRWIAERCFDGTSRNRRIARDFPK